MAQEFLDGPQVPAALEQVAGKRVSEHVRMDLQAQASGLGLFGKQALNRSTGQTLATLIDKEGWLIEPFWPPGQDCRSLWKPGLQGL